MVGVSGIWGERVADMSRRFRGRCAAWLADGRVLLLRPWPTCASASTAAIGLFTSSLSSLIPAPWLFFYCTLPSLQACSLLCCRMRQRGMPFCICLLRALGMSACFRTNGQQRN